MVLKRKRNLKIDANSVYSVFLLKDLDPGELEDYIENRDTGMEADEEKEIHLQNIIKGGENSIPLPVIQEIRNISRNFYKKIELPSHIDWRKDCSNEYIQTEEDKKIIESKTINSQSNSKEKKDIDNENTTQAVSSFNTNTPNDTNAINNNISKTQISNSIEHLNASQRSDLDVSQTDKIENTPLSNPIIKKFKSNDEIPYYENSNIQNFEGHDSDFNATNTDSQNISSIANSPKGYLSPGSIENRPLGSQEPFIPPNLNLPLLISKAGEHKSFTSGKNEDLINFCVRRVLLRYEKHGYETYTCFRDRIFHPTFKSRRNEALMIEKITRMGIEFSTLNKLCELYKEKTINELEIIKKTFEIVKKAEKLKLDRKQKKAVSKMLFEGLSKTHNANKRLSMHMAMTDRDKIQNLRNFKTSTDLFVDIKYYDIFMKFVKFKK